MGGKSMMSSHKIKTLKNRKELPIIILIVFMILFLGSTSDIFFNIYNIDSLQTSIAPKAIIATGMMLLFITGFFDLSVGSVMGLSGVVTALCLVNGFSVFLSIIFGLLTGVTFGFINGFLIGIVGINHVIATIGTMYVGRGLINVLLEGSARRGVRGFNEKFIQIGAGKTFGIYNMFWIMIIVIVVAQLVITKLDLGRKLYFIGGNIDAAKLIGIKVKRTKIIVYVLSGLLAALAGILVTARLEMASRALGSGLELEIIISCLIGGGSIAGGKGTIVGALLGCIFMSLINNSFTLLMISSFWQNIVIGTLLILVIGIDSYLQIKREKA